MGVYIPGMEMPKTCAGCDFVEPIGLVCTKIHKFLDREDYRCERHRDCPLVEIPEPYGKLIDDNAMYLALAIIMAGTLSVTENTIVDSAPIIIEAEREGSENQ